jgi:hypothetical protein
MRRSGSLRKCRSFVTPRLSLGSQLWETARDSKNAALAVPKKFAAVNNPPYWLRLSPDERVVGFARQCPECDSLWEVRVDGSNLDLLIPRLN